MISLLENFKTLAESDEPAVILCNAQQVLQFKTFKEVMCLTDIITKFLSEYVADQNICLALFMNHNILIVLVRSLQKLKHAFMFLTPKLLKKAGASFKLNWIISLDDINEIEQFEAIHRLRLNEKCLVLWHRQSMQVNDFNYLNIFCVVQTSGSTGENKLIRVSHSCIEVNASALRKLFQINSKDIIYWGTPLTFDPSFIELLLALQSGACLLTVPHDVAVNPQSLYKALFCIKKITVLQMVPSVFQQWDENQIQNVLNNPGLRILAFGGENFPKSVLSCSRCSNLRIFNLYGISEVSCWAAAYEINNECCDDEIPIGESLDETLIEIRDEKDKILDCGEGEIYIGSCSRICYVNDEGLENNCKPVFRETGDIARINEKGVYLVGRKNKVIKRFGHKVNLGKIESMVLTETGLENRCVWLPGSNKILSFILIRNLDPNVKNKTLDKLRVKLISILPEECFPDFIEIVANFPLTSHGKIDEKALEKLYLKPKTTSNCADTFCNLWCKYFGIGIDKLDEIKAYKFSEMGGNSIMALQFITELKELISDCPQEIYMYVFEKSFEECLQILKAVKLTRKRDGEQITTEHVRKKERVSKNGLKVLWSYDLKACVDGSPLVFEKEGAMYVSVGSFAHILTILNERGENVFKTVLPDSVESTPTVSPCHNYLLTGCFNGVMYCVHILKKEIVWEYKTCGKIKSSACFCKDNSAIVFGSYDKRLHCVSVESGTALWNTLLDGSIAANPVHDNNTKRIFTASTAGTCFCLNEDVGSILWEYNCGGPVFGTPCLLPSKQAVVFPAVQGVLHCLSLLNGEVLWTFQAGGYIFSSVVYYEDCLVFGCHDKNIYIVKDCKILHKIVLDSEISSTPFICNINSEAFIVSACNSGMVYVLELRTCKILCSLQMPAEVFSSPFVFNSKIYIGCRDNNLYCVELDVPK